MQNTLLAIGLALIAALLAAIAGPWLVDWNRHKPFIEREAAAFFGVPVTIRGDLSVRLLPTLSVDARDVAFGTERGGALIGRLRGELRLAPLLRGEVSLNALSVRDADIRLSPAGLPARAVAVEELTVDNARVAVAGEGGETVLAERVRLVGESRGARGPIRLEGSGLIGEAAAPLSLLASFTETGGLAVRLRSAGRSDGLTVEAEGVVGAEGRPRFDGQVVLAGTAGRLAWRIAGQAAATPESLVFERAEAVVGSGERIARATGSLRYRWAGEPAVDAVVSARQLDLDRLIEAPEGAARTPREAIAALVGAAPGIGRASLPVTVGLDALGVTLGGQLVGDVAGDIRIGPEGWNVERLSARLPGDSAVSLAGRVTLTPDLGFAGRLTVQSARPGVMLSWLDGQETPAGTLDDPIRLSAELAADSGRLVLDDLDAATAAGTARGRIALDMPALGRHALAVDLAAEALDLDLLARLARGAGARLDPATDSRLKIRTAEARLAGFVARGVDMTIASDGRRFEAERLRIVDLAGLGLDLTGRLDGLGGPLTGRIGGRLTAASPDGLVRLLARDERTRALSRRVAARAGAIGASDIAFAFEAGRGAALKLTAEGRVGAADVTLAAEGTGDLGAPGELAGRAALTAASPRADQLALLVTGLLPLNAVAVPARLDLIATLGPAGLALEGRAEARGTRLTVAAERAEAGGLRATARLASQDLSPLLPLVGVPAELAGPMPAALEARGLIGADGAWRAEEAKGEVGPTRVEASLAGRGTRLTGRLALGTLSAEALASLLTGPAWLVEGEAGGFAAAAFGETAFGALEGSLALTAETVGLGGYPPLAGVSAKVAREGGRTTLTDLRGRLAGAALAGRLTLDRSPVATVMSASLALDQVPVALAFPGAGGAGPLSLDIVGEGTGPQALVASLRGGGRHAWPAGTVTGVAPAALGRAARLAEVAQDLGRPMSDEAFAAALARELDRPTALPATEAALTLSGTLLRAAGVRFAAGAGEVAWSGQADLAEGTLEATARVTPEPVRGAETLPLVTVHARGPLGAAEREVDADDVSGWLGLRLVDREALRLLMAESDRLERARQRAFTRFTSQPPRRPEVGLPPLPPPVTRELVLEAFRTPEPPPAAAPEPAPSPSPEGPVETSEDAPDNAPVPPRRPAEPRAAPPRAGAGDLPHIVRRALDGQPRAPQAAPLSILPPLPPPVEVGPAPGMRR